jgi:hypothetical protein
VIGIDPDTGWGDNRDGKPSLGKKEVADRSPERRGPSSVPVLNAAFTPGIGPGDRTIGAGDQAAPAFQTPGKLDLHLSGFFVEGVEICRTGVDAKPFPAGLTGSLVQSDVTLLIVLKGINGQLFFDPHGHALVLS